MSLFLAGQCSAITILPNVTRAVLCRIASISAPVSALYRRLSRLYIGGSISAPVSALYRFMHRGCLGCTALEEREAFESADEMLRELGSAERWDLGNILVIAQ